MTLAGADIRSTARHVLLWGSGLALLFACGSGSGSSSDSGTGATAGDDSGGALTGSGGQGASSGGSSSGGSGSGGSGSGGSGSGGSNSGGSGSGGSGIGAADSESGGAPAGSGGQSSGGSEGGSSSSGGSEGEASGGQSATGGAGSAEPGPELTTISWGTTLQPPDVVSAARALAEGQRNPSSPDFRAKGDQHRTYRFDDAGQDLPYRLFVPTDWDEASELPLVLFLHGAGNDESSYVDANGKQMIQLAEEHDYILVSPLGADGAYGSFLRLPAVFGEPAEAAAMVAAKTDQSERAQEWSERDVINVLELVLAEYPVDRQGVFLMGHSMGSGGTWYLGGKYSFYFCAIAPMSGPFVQESVYPWERMMSVPMFVTEGTDTPSLVGSRALRDWLAANGYPYEYEEVAADHGGMVPLVLPHVFDFFDRMR